MWKRKEKSTLESGSHAKWSLSVEIALPLKIICSWRTLVIQEGKKKSKSKFYNTYLMNYWMFGVLLDLQLNPNSFSNHSIGISLKYQRYTYIHLYFRMTREALTFLRYQVPIYFVYSIQGRLQAYLSASDN